MDLGLSGKVAIVTGGSEGIGKAAALVMSREGARVAICARRADVLEAAADEIRKTTGGDILAASTDVRDEDQVKVLVQRVVDRWGRVDVLVNNAGTSSAQPFEQLTDEIWNEDIQLKVYGAIYFCRAVIPHMRAQGGGAIVNITTPTGKAPREASLPTSLSRAAGIGLTKVLSREYAPENIRVNTVCIGLIKSGQHERRYERSKEQNPGLTLDQQYAEMGKGVPMGRVGEAIEAGDVIAFLASDRASYVTGTSVNVDGGASPVV